MIQLEGRKRWRLYDRPDAATSPRTLRVTQFTAEEIGEPVADFWLEAGDVMYFPRGTVHQATTSDDVHSLHLTFSTFQRHTYYDLVARMPLAPKDRARLVALEQEVGWHHTDLPTNVLDPSLPATHASTSNASARRRKLQSKAEGFAGAARAHKAPKWMVRALGNQAYVDAALDAYAADFLVNSLPPVPPSMPCLSAEQLELILAGNEDESEQEQGPNAEQLLDELTVALRARHCLRMVVPQAGGDDADDDATGEQQGAVLSTNAANGRAFEASASPQFEVLPALIPAVQRLLQVVPTGLGAGGCAVRLSALVEAAGGNEGEKVNDLLELLMLLTEYGAVDVVQVSGGSGGGGEGGGEGVGEGGGEGVGEGGGCGSGSGAATVDSCDEEGGCCDAEGNCSKKGAGGGGSGSSHHEHDGKKKRKRKRKKNAESGEA